MSASITVATPATLAEVAAQGLAYMAGQTGVASDANIGSQIRTIFEGFGQIAEYTGVMDQALAFQAVVYACMFVFGITPLPAASAVGSVIFSTGTTSPPPATQNVIISQGTIVSTTGGTQYQTTQTVTLVQGTTSITAPIAALVAGAAGNDSTPNTITQIVSGLAYPLFVTNSSSIVGGTDAESPSATLGRFIAKVMSIGLASPVAIANAAIGIQPPGSTEIVKYATVFEPWTQQSPGSQVAGFTLYIDNGSGTASAPLIAQVENVLNGSFPTMSGYRDAGVPYSVVAVTSTNYSVVVAGVLIDPTQDAATDQAVVTALQAFQATLQFGVDIQESQITAVVGDVLTNAASSFTVQLLNGSGTPETVITVADISRALLTSVTSNLT